MKRMKRAGTLLLVLMFMAVWICSPAFGLITPTTGGSSTNLTATGTALTPVVTVTPTTPTTPIGTSRIPTTPTTPTVPGVIRPVQPVEPLPPINPDLINLKPRPVIIYPEKDVTIEDVQPILVEFTIAKKPDYYKVYLDFGDGYFGTPDAADVIESKWENNAYHVSIFCPSMSGYGSSDKAIARVSAYWDWDDNTDSSFTISQPFKNAGYWDDQIKAAAGNNSVTLSWDPVAARPGRVLYTIERRLFENGTWTPLTDFAIADTTYTDSTAVNLTAYEYRVSAKIGNAVRQIYKTATAQPKGGTLVMTVGSTTINLNGTEKQIDSPPVIVSGRTFVPIRALVENIGGTIDYDASIQQITIKYLGRTVVMQIGSTEATVNGTPVTVAVPPYISDEGRTMIPLRFVVENLGLYVYWNDANQSITINF